MLEVRIEFVMFFVVNNYSIYIRSPVSDLLIPFICDTYHHLSGVGWR